MSTHAVFIYKGPYKCYSFWCKYDGHPERIVPALMKLQPEIILDWFMLGDRETILDEKGYSHNDSVVRTWDVATPKLEEHYDNYGYEYVYTYMAQKHQWLCNGYMTNIEVVRYFHSMKSQSSLFKAEEEEGRERK